MISYDKVILKRLRFKGDPPAPAISAAEIGLAPAEEGDTLVENGSPKVDLDKEIEQENGTESPVDERTEAEKRFARQTSEQRMRQLRAQAGTTYKQQVEKFNERLAKQTEHNDMFKVSFTK